MFVQRAKRYIVEEEQRAGAFGQDVIDIEGNQVLAHALEVSQLRRNFQLGAHAVGARHQNGLVDGIQCEEAGKTAAAVQHLGAVGNSRKSLDAVFQPFHRVQRDAGSLVGSRWSHAARFNVIVQDAAISSDSLPKSNCTGTG